MWNCLQGTLLHHNLRNNLREWKWQVHGHQIPVVPQTGTDIMCPLKL